VRNWGRASVPYARPTVETAYGRILRPLRQIALVTGGPIAGSASRSQTGLARAGATVVLNAARRTRSTRRRRRLREQGLAADTSVFDVTIAPRCGSVAAIQAAHGASTSCSTTTASSAAERLVDFFQSDWDAGHRDQPTAPFIVSQAVLRGNDREQARQDRAHRLAHERDGGPSVVPYTAAKGVVRQLTRGMAVELAPHNIQVNAIAPVISRPR